MNPYFPIYTEKAECQDCYKCVRQCPTKAIHVENGSASVIQERCILCGHCVEICPVGAKKVRNDLGRVKRLLQLKNKVIISLAPSYVSEFNNVKPAQLIHALKKLGFYGVSETALGAQEVSSHVATRLKQEDKQILISSACPTVVKFIKKYYPDYSDYITDLYSPVLAHSTYLRQQYDEDIGIVFIGPCISKKYESDTFSDLLDVAITFEGLRNWLKEENIVLEKINPLEEDYFIPEKADEGVLYPIDGGMIAGIKANCSVNDACFMSFSGIDKIETALHDLASLKPAHNLFIEMLACEGGCISGPKVEHRSATILKRYNIINNASYPEREIPRKTSFNINAHFDDLPLTRPEHDDQAIKKVLKKVGKYSSKDELNCGGCGYDSCKEFARALLDGKAEKSMCVSYMRQLAHKKANALLKTMPSGVVIVDDELKIVECNANFAKLLGEDAEMVYNAKPGMQGALLEKLLPFTHFFKNVLETGIDLLDKDIKYEKSILHASIFSIEKYRIVGGVIQDITAPSIHKEQIIKKTKKVIEKNLSTVQKIAYLLGENASETEVMLDSIIKSYSSESNEQ